jgi:hypothetical protein
MATRATTGTPTCRNGTCPRSCTRERERFGRTDESGAEDENARKIIGNEPRADAGADARPAIANPLDSIGRYDTVLLGSPIWNVRAPMIMSTFAESLDFAGKAVYPFTTYAVSGLGTAVRDYTASCPGATIGEGLAVRGEEAGVAGEMAASWLRRIGLLTT